MPPHLLPKLSARSLTMLPIMMRAPGGVHLDVPGTTLEVGDRSDGVS